MIEFLFFAVPILLSAFLTLPAIFAFRLIRSRFERHAVWIAAGLGFFWALGVFLFLTLILLSFGVPADENAGEAVVLFLSLGALGAGVSQVTYWVLWFTVRSSSKR